MQFDKIGSSELIGCVVYLYLEAGNISIGGVFESNIGMSVIKPENNSQPCSAGRLQNLLPF